MAANERKDDLAPGEIRYTTGDGQYNTGYVKDGYVYTDKDYTTPIPTDSVVNTAGGYYRKGNYGSFAVGSTDDYKDQMQGYLYQINNRKPFQFDLNNDALYQQYKDQFTKLGKAAMEDTMGQAAGLTGGYGSTYGQAVGQQQYQAYLDRLNEIVPDIYAKQKSEWDAGTQELYNRYNAAHNGYQTARQEQADADSKIAMYLQMGITPPADLVAASSYSASEIESMRNYYSNMAQPGQRYYGDPVKDVVYGNGVDSTNYSNLYRGIREHIAEGNYQAAKNLFSQFADQLSEDQYSELYDYMQSHNP